MPQGCSDGKAGHRVRKPRPGVNLGAVSAGTLGLPHASFRYSPESTGPAPAWRRSCLRDRCTGNEKTRSAWRTRAGAGR